MSRDFGSSSSPTITVAPVVVIPETDSKIASLTLIPKNKMELIQRRLKQPRTLL